jgi:hypothetical protein
MQPDFAIINRKGVECRCCGSSHTIFTSLSKEICGTCITKLTNNNKRMWVINDEAELTAALAERLVKELKKVRAGRVTGRCECVSTWVSGLNGWQCGSNAKYVRDGRKVCGTHYTHPRPVYIDQTGGSPYHPIKVLVSTLAKMDPDFKQVVTEAVNES